MNNHSFVNRVLVVLLIMNAAGVVYVALRDNAAGMPDEELGAILRAARLPKRSVVPTPVKITIEIQKIGKDTRAAANGDTLAVLMDRKPFTFVLGSAPQFSAWKDGITGMREGERRKFTRGKQTAVFELVRIERPTPMPQ